MLILRTWLVPLMLALGALAHAGKAPTFAPKVKPVKFDLTMTMKRKASGKEAAGGPMEASMSMKGWIKSLDQMRFEMDLPLAMGGGSKGKLSGTMKMVQIIDGAWLYMVNPGMKTAMKMPKPPGGMGGLGMGLPGFDPSKGGLDLKELERLGIKKSGRETVAGVACEVYKGKLPQGQMSGDLTVWNNTKTQFPLKMELKSATMDIAADFKNVERNPKLAEALFKVPADYKVQERPSKMGGAGPVGPPPGPPGKPR